MDYSAKNKAKLDNVIGKYVAKIAQRKADTAIIEIVGEQVQIKQILEELGQFGIKELIRTGKIAMTF